uniref:NEDD8-conjugating enzyme UBC12 n=1 Tax=Sarcophilus harrisii TaxID=9305 RepID=A0A7N4P2P8_SARHA
SKKEKAARNPIWGQRTRRGRDRERPPGRGRGGAEPHFRRHPSGAERFRGQPSPSETGRASYGSRDGPRGAALSGAAGAGTQRSRAGAGAGAGAGRRQAAADSGRGRPAGQGPEEESAGGTKGSSKKASAAQLRIQKDINELNLPKTCEIDFSDQDDLLNFKLVICPDEGFYKAGKFVFSFKVGQGYPHDPPKVKCETMVYHPNIDLEGNVCLNILREDWKPVLTINSIIYGLQYLFLEPNPEDPLNKEAAEVLQNNRRLFEQNVQRSMRGGYIGSTYFERCLK